MESIDRWENPSLKESNVRVAKQYILIASKHYQQQEKQTKQKWNKIKKK